MSPEERILEAIDHLSESGDPDFWVNRIREIAAGNNLSLPAMGISDADLAELRKKRFVQIVVNTVAEIKATDCPRVWVARVAEVLRQGITLADADLTQEQYDGILLAAWLRDVARCKQNIGNGDLTYQEDLRNAQYQIGLLMQPA